MEVHFGPFHGNNTYIDFPRKHICEVSLAAIRQPYMIRMEILSNKHKKASLNMIFNTIKKQNNVLLSYWNAILVHIVAKVPI